MIYHQLTATGIARHPKGMELKLRNLRSQLACVCVCVRACVCSVCVWCGVCV
jgi:hypothetical protein